MYVNKPELFCQVKSQEQIRLKFLFRFKKMLKKLNAYNRSGE